MHRMYVDEVGNADLASSHDPNHRYLSLTGVILDVDYVDRIAAPKLEDFKRRHFRTHVDEPLILHRKELLNRNYPFDALRDPECDRYFCDDLIRLLSDLQMTVLTAAIDKQEHLSRYPSWQYHPYHYCQEVLVERFARWMKRRGFQGDVYGESRGKKEDKQLKTAFRAIYTQGNGWLRAEEIQRSIVVGEIKLKRKEHNIAGLQIADLIAHPSFRCMLARRTGQAPPQDFGGRIATLLEDQKYDRSPAGLVEGWGRKWLP